MGNRAEKVARRHQRKDNKSKADADRLRQRSIYERLRQLGIKWRPDENFAADGKGFHWQQPAMPNLFAELQKIGATVQPIINSAIGTSQRRPFYKNVLLGSSSFCFLLCELIGTHPLTKGDFADLAGTQLWVFRIPDDVFAECKSRIPNLGQYFCFPVNRDNQFPTWNWNPIGLDAAEDATKYLGDVFPTGKT